MSGGGQTILMITDNLSVGVVTARFLNSKGYGVSTAPDADSALGPAG